MRSFAPIPPANTDTDALPGLWLFTGFANFHPSNVLACRFLVQCSACETRHSLNLFVGLN